MMWSSSGRLWTSLTSMPLCWCSICIYMGSRGLQSVVKWLSPTLLTVWWVFLVDCMCRPPIFLLIIVRDRRGWVSEGSLSSLRNVGGGNSCPSLRNSACNFIHPLDNSCSRRRRSLRLLFFCSFSNSCIFSNSYIFSASCVLFIVNYSL